MTIEQAFAAALQHHQSGRLAEAEAIYREILAVEPRQPGALHYLGVIAHQVGRHELAVDLIQQAIAIAPAIPDFYSNLGEAYRRLGQVDTAIAAYRQALALHPDYPEAHSNLGNALWEKGQLNEAIAACRRAIALRPDYPEAHSNLGVALSDQGQYDAAIAACRQAIAYKPDYAEAYNNLGNALKEKGQLAEAAAAYRQAIALNPNYADACFNLAVTLRDEGQLDTAIAAYRQARALKPGDLEAHSILLHTLHCHPGLDARAIAEEHRLWNREHAEPLARFVPRHPNDRSPDRRLRIGYVSPDFRGHSVAYFLEDLFAGHDPAQVEIFCYANLKRPDEVTARLRQMVPHWREILGLPDAQVAALVGEDKIDILVDLAGHTARGRLPLFARKPAPLQVTWLGYPGTTGLEAMDFRLTDARADPPGMTEHLHTERLVRLPDGAWCFRPSAQTPLVSEPPVRHNGRITFGCFNAMAKITTPLLILWSRILHGLPGSRLLLKNRSLLDASTRERIQAVFTDAGIGPERIELADYTTTVGDHLAIYGQVDIALDTFPYHGTTTTCEALWMGVPVVTLAGQTHASRVGVSLLSSVGLPELIAASSEEYLRIAVNLGHEVERLSELRAGLRARMSSSPLMDGPRFARNLEQAYRQMWRDWCGKRNPPQAQSAGG